MAERSSAHAPRGAVLRACTARSLSIRSGDRLGISEAVPVRNCTLEDLGRGGTRCSDAMLHGGRTRQRIGRALSWLPWVRVLCLFCRPRSLCIRGSKAVSGPLSRVELRRRWHADQR